MDAHKQTISIAYLTSNTKEIVKEQQIKHEKGQIKKFVNKLKSRLKIHECRPTDRHSEMKYIVVTKQE
ncbi:hypothetical protein LEP1GSC034_2374 [Leptospira interrogans str. 2003000735]|uniref:Transposase domain protein n=2 Tax=Leptospira interrogans TaxID=173 RepID=A0A829D571_LEPIR|nr:hypothetical protein LEP1GSC027_3193 [Leptospira interrogans str. 2002000624]EKQ38424.1 hypothetical protein LEP1GSC025_3828 [Leptospira interrogans str. 2002000621]EKQ47529.1 hypothetical protein LEP1GSC026_4586 [Leptospira interrogans str. 2002000623]EMJ67976.1 hypothetical protein LEP1GSC034_2374 [Leptospira interrogans str. 2003000735]EMY04059.1 hypothetical protein LEP1GSC029_2153 [Leptospira interrogans str. 2002000626]EMY27523.1 hypothetical protein LEP1GSC115_5194 [Leptospira interr